MHIFNVHLILIIIIIMQMYTHAITNPKFRTHLAVMVKNNEGCKSGLFT